MSPRATAEDLVQWREDSYGAANSAMTAGRFLQAVAWITTALAAAGAVFALAHWLGQDPAVRNPDYLGGLAGAGLAVAAFCGSLYALGIICEVHGRRLYLGLLESEPTPVLPQGATEKAYLEPS